MRKFIFLLASFFIFLSINFAWSATIVGNQTWAIVVNHDDCTISTINLSTDPPTVYGPFLSGQLGDYNSLDDVVITSNGHYALVTNFFEEKVYFIDLSDPTNPALAGSVNIGFPAEDIAITPDNKYALVTDGGHSQQIALIDISSMSLKTTYTLSGNLTATCIATNGNLVAICSYDNNSLIYGQFDPDNLISSENIITTDTPINATFSPDGQTLLVANALNASISVFQVSGSIISPGSPSTIGVPDGPQSIAFSPDSTKAYLVSYGPSPDNLSWLQINGPRNVSLGGAGVAELLSDANGGWYGVDVLAITPDGNYALAGNPSNGNGNSNNVSLINLSDFSVASINTNTQYPAGIAVFQRYNPTPSLPVPTLTEWGMIILSLLLAVSAFLFVRRFKNE